MDLESEGLREEGLSSLDEVPLSRFALDLREDIISLIMDDRVSYSGYGQYDSNTKSSDVVVSSLSMGIMRNMSYPELCKRRCRERCRVKTEFSSSGGSP